MIQKCSILQVQDLNGVFTVKCFHTYFKYFNNISSSGLITKNSIKIYSKLRKKWKGKKTKAVVLTSKARFVKPDGCQIISHANTCGLLKKRLSMRGKLTKGYIFYNLKKKKFINSFSLIIKCLKTFTIMPFPWTYHTYLIKKQTCIHF